MPKFTLIRELLDVMGTYRPGAAERLQSAPPGTWSVKEARACNNRALRAACAAGDLECAEVLVAMFGLTAGDGICALKEVCEVHGDAGAAKWLVSRLGIPLKAVRGNISIGVACLNNNASVAEWLRADAKCPLDGIDFGRVCERGMLNAAKWIVGATGIEVNRENAKYAFTDVCFYGKREMADWLADTFAITPEHVRRLDNCALRMAAANEHMDFFWWLIEKFGLTKEDVTSDSNDVLCELCERGDLKSAIKVVEKFGLGAGGDLSSGRILRAACNSEKVCMVEWVVDTFDLTAADATRQVYSAVRECKINRRPVILAYLVERLDISEDTLKEALERTG